MSFTHSFIGIDFAWRSDKHPTGAVLMRGDRSGARVDGLSTLRSGEAVLDFVLANATENIIIAIDAPLIIVNEAGQRLCETEIGKRYGRNDASCHTSNLKLYKDANSVRLTTSLLANGFDHVAVDKEERIGRLVAEVYPHAAMVELFNLEKIIKYKKGSVSAKRLGLEELRGRLGALTKAEPRIVMTDALRGLLTANLEKLAGRALKNYEDILDALFCSYLGYYFWYWGWKRNQLFGDLVSGYILNPKVSDDKIY